MGCVLPAGLGQAPARQAAIAAGIPMSAGCTTINKVCGSGMKAVMFGHDLIMAGSAGVVVAGGMESMTNAPHLLNGSRTGIRYGSAEMLDHMAWDGLTNPYDKQAMGVFGELCAGKYSFTREEQDAFAAESVRRALAAQADGAFKDEIAPVTVAGRKGDVVVDTDEQPGRCDIAKIPTLRPAFKKDGTITAASSSSINDGAAALVLASEDQAKALGLAPLARIVAHSTHSQEPEWFTTAPVGAISKLLAKAGWNVGDGRPVRGQRGLCRGRDGADPGTGHFPCQAQRQRRCLRPGPPDRCQRCAPDRDPDPRPAAPGRKTRHRGPVHRRRRGHGDRDRTGLTAVRILSRATFALYWRPASGIS